MSLPNHMYGPKGGLAIPQSDPVPISPFAAARKVQNYSDEWNNIPTRSHAFSAPSLIHVPPAAPMPRPTQPMKEPPKFDLPPSPSLQHMVPSAEDMSQHKNPDFQGGRSLRDNNSFLLEMEKNNQQDTTDDETVFVGGERRRSSGRFSDISNVSLSSSPILSILHGPIADAPPSPNSKTRTANSNHLTPTAFERLQGLSAPDFTPTQTSPNLYGKVTNRRDFAAQLRHQRPPSTEQEVEAKKRNSGNKMQDQDDELMFSMSFGESDERTAMSGLEDMSLYKKTPARGYNHYSQNQFK